MTQNELRIATPMNCDSVDAANELALSLPFAFQPLYTANLSELTTYFETVQAAEATRLKTELQVRNAVLRERARFD